MIVVYGGIYQGKLQFVREELQFNDVYECKADSIEVDLSKKVIYKFHNLVLAQIRNGISPKAWAEENLELLKNSVIISDEISSGVVPIDKEERLWLLELGAVLNLLSKKADKVYRVFMGIAGEI